MSTATRGEEQHGVWQEFADPTLEQAYRDHHLTVSMPALRVSIASSAPAWLIGAIVVVESGVQHLPLFLASLLVLHAPVTVWLYWASYQSKWAESARRASALSNLSATMVAGVCGLLGMHAMTFALSGSVIIVLFGLMTLRLLRRAAWRLVVGTIGVMGGAAGAEWATGHMSTVDLVTFVGMLLVAVMMGLRVSDSFETQDRASFIQERALAEQRALVDAERQRSEALLHAILPPTVARRLKDGKAAIADEFDSVSVLFADLCGFTAWASGKDPRTVVVLLDEIFSRFDALVAARGLERIKTIGDAYMVAAGLPTPRADHAEAIVDLGLAMLEEIQAIRASSGAPLALRVGVHSGPVVAGVIGTTKFSYDLWGDSVNVASRMESHGEPGAVQVSAATAAQLHDGFALGPARRLQVKGKGEIETFLVLTRRAVLPRGNSDAG